MSLSVIIRPAVTDDLERLIDISERTFVEASSWNNIEEDVNAYVSKAFSRVQLQEELQNPYSAFFFALLSHKDDDDTIVGYCKINLFDAQKENICQKDSIQLQRLYVDQRYQGQGVGQQLLSYVEQHIARDLYHVSSIWLTVWDRNERAIRFYEQHGYEKLGTIPFMCGNDEQTDNLMRKKLD